MYAIYDDQTETALSTGHPTIEEAQEHMQTMLARTRGQIEATGDSAAGMVLEWSVRLEDTGRPVAWYHGPPPTGADYE